MEGLFQHHHNKENIPPFFTISKSFDNKLGAKMTLKKKKKYRKPLADITNLFVDSLNQSPVISPAVFRPQSCSVFRSADGEGRCRSLSHGINEDTVILVCDLNDIQVSVGK
ncbi:hypothetical protein L1987_86400 [Smallanthus sonchifolius]|uniref:Uncharacterized protein n=1 Tax=Smallanthus sonchifolius TaxID=185202 RepID=A0ACB8XYM9_9ASTR|nr:hypothetical protein L1987_86400 [Smallanthus sonchifolius]